MSLRLALATVVLVSLPLSVSAQTRTLASGVLDARWNFDFACSLVNKDETGEIAVTVVLKDEAGMTARNPYTQMPQILTATLAPGEAATLVVPAGFSGVTSLYCWAEVPLEASAFGSFMVRDSAKNSTAATPLEEDVALAARSVLEELDAVHVTIEDSIDAGNPARSAFQAWETVTVEPGVVGVFALPVAEVPDGERLTVEFVSIRCTTEAANPVTFVSLGIARRTGPTTASTLNFQIPIQLQSTLSSGNTVYVGAQSTRLYADPIGSAGGVSANISRFSGTGETSCIIAISGHTTRMQ